MVRSVVILAFMQSPTSYAFASKRNHRYHRCMDLKQIQEALLATLDTEGSISVVTILLIIASVVVARMVSKQFTYKIVDRVMQSHKYPSLKEKRQRRDTLIAVLATLSTVLYIIVGVVLILNELGVNLGALITGLGALGVVIGIAGQSAIKDFLRGMAILFYDQMRVGDIVEIAGRGGQVEEISIFITRLRDLDGYVHVVPNGEINVVTNMSQNHANVNLDVGVAYHSDIDEVERVVNEVGTSMSSDQKWQDLIIEPIQFLRVDSFGDSSVKVKALGKVLPGEQWTVAGEYRRRLKKAFEKQNIEIPFPQRVIHKAE